MYIKRHIENTIVKAGKSFPAVLITGPRQVGKSTVLKNLFKDTKHQTLDDFLVLDSVKSDPKGFLDLSGTPLVIDEIQREPELFISLKLKIDADRRNGMYYLTGSQSFNLMKGVSESLAGRIAIIKMLGLSGREIYGDDFSVPFLPTSEYLISRNTKIESNVNTLWEKIHKGSMPEMFNQEEIDWEQFYSSYVETYIERDVKALSEVGNTMAFMQFMVALASRTGNLLNMSDIASNIGISIPTVKKWISVLQASNIIYILQPFSLNLNSRIVKTPKVYFTDTGLVCYLCRWLTPETLQNGAMAGQIYETFVIDEIIKSYYNAGKNPPIYFFRNTDGQEIDLLFYSDNQLYPIEIKKTSSPNIKDIKSFKTLETYFPSLEIAEGGIICNSSQLLPFNGKNRIIPINYI